ncbi:HlyD family secretion protein, partial [Escherichia coli]|nr:HlyD family secretion protein [Escherichia coli]
MRQQQDELGRFSICSRQAAGVLTAQQSHIDSLKQAMLLIESKLPTTREP